MFLSNSYHSGYCKNSLISDMINMDCIICIVTGGDVYVLICACVCVFIFLKRGNLSNE